VFDEPAWVFVLKMTDFHISSAISIILTEPLHFLPLSKQKVGTAHNNV
jgi:hypothetical protein